MGLDVYCEWPGITEEEKRAQITGFQNAGKAGYLRQSWWSLRAWNEVFKAVFGITWDDMLFPGWGGGNDGDGPDLSKPEERQRLEGVCEQLTAYINNPTPVPESCRHYFSGDSWERAIEIVSGEVQDMIDFIKLALSKEGAKIIFS